jgi:hypothetical protein
MIRSLLSLPALLLLLSVNVQAQSFFGELDYKPLELSFRDEKRLPFIMKEERMNFETGEYEYLEDNIFYYNSKKDFEKVIKVSGADSLEKTIFSYDAKGRNTESFTYLWSAERNEWFAFDQLLTEYNADGSVKKSLNHFYDITGTLVKTEGSMVEKLYDSQSRLMEYINWIYVDTGWVKETSESYFYTGTSVYYDSLHNYTHYSPSGPMLSPLKKRVTSIKRNQQGKPLEYIIRREPESIQEQDTILVNYTYNDSGSVKDIYYWNDDQLLFRLANRTVKYTTPVNHIVSIFYQEYGDVLTPQYKVTLFLDSKKRLTGYNYLMYSEDAWMDYQHLETSFVRDKAGILQEVLIKSWQYGELTEQSRTSVVSYVESGAVAIRDASEKPALFVAPNPAGSFIKLNDIKGEKVVIYNSEGIQAIISEKTEDGIVDIESLTPGLYFIKVSGENGETARGARFIKR